MGRYKLYEKKVYWQMGLAWEEFEFEFVGDVLWRENLHAAAVGRFF